MQPKGISVVPAKTHGSEEKIKLQERPSLPTLPSTGGALMSHSWVGGSSISKKLLLRWLRERCLRRIFASRFFAPFLFFEANNFLHSHFSHFPQKRCSMEQFSVAANMQILQLVALVSLLPPNMEAEIAREAQLLDKYRYMNYRALLDKEQVQNEYSCISVLPRFKIGFDFDREARIDDISILILMNWCLELSNIIF